MHVYQEDFKQLYCILNAAGGGGGGIMAKLWAAVCLCSHIGNVVLWGYVNETVNLTHVTVLVHVTDTSCTDGGITDQ
jgi:hypothetical protein